MKLHVTHVLVEDVVAVSNGRLFRDFSIVSRSVQCANCRSCAAYNRIQCINYRLFRWGTWEYDYEA